MELWFHRGRRGGGDALHGARLQKFAEEVYLKDLDKTVRFVPNYDETEKEPEVLPVRVPNLLINGARELRSA